MERKMTEDKQKHLEDLYRKVAKEFPEIKEEEIEIRYQHNSWDINIFTLKYVTRTYRVFKKPALIRAGMNFLNYSQEEQEAVIAHEIGHYVENKNKGIRKLKLSFDLIEKLTQYGAGKVYLSRRKLEIIKDVYLRREIAADNWAVKKDYGKGLLKNLKKDYSKMCAELPKEKLNVKERDWLVSCQELLARRIASLEEKIKEQEI